MQGDVIVNRILSDAQLKASEIINEANEKVNKINEDINIFADEKSKEVTIKLEEASKQLSDRYATLAKIEGNKIILNKKQEVLKDLKNQALNTLLQLNKEDMLALVEKLLKANASKDETILFNIKNVTKKDIESLEIVSKLNLSVTKNANENQYGMILVSQTCDKNLLFEQLISDAFEQNQAEIHEILFN